MDGSRSKRLVTFVLLTLAAGAGFATDALLVSPAAARGVPTASVSVDHTVSFLGSSAEPFVFAVTNTSTDPIGQVVIAAASDSFLPLPPPFGPVPPLTVTGCLGAPAGWTATVTGSQCRWTASAANAILPAQSRSFTVRADVSPGTRDRVATFTASVGAPSSAAPVPASPASLAVDVRSWEIIDVVVNTGAPAGVGGGCPVPRRQAPSGTTVGLVVCGINHMTVTATPATATLAGTLIVPPPGSWTSGPVAPSVSPVVLGNWAGVALNQATGEHTVVARVASAVDATSPVTTFGGYTTNSPPVANGDTYTVNEDQPLTVVAPGVLGNDTDADGDALSVVLPLEVAAVRGVGVVNGDGSFTYTPQGNVHGVDSFTYRASDGAAVSNPVVVTITVTPVADPPTDITLSGQTVVENQPAGVVGTFATADVDLPGDAHLYGLVTGTGDTHNGQFTVADGQLKTAGPLDFEAGATRSIRVRSTDNAGNTVEKPLTITVTNLNEAPTAIGLSPSSVGENLPSGTRIGDLSSTDPDLGDTFTYTVVGTTDFAVSGRELRTADSFDFEAGASYPVTIRTVDAGGLAVEQVVTVTILNANEPPTAISLTPSAIAENQPSGTTVGTLSTTDPDTVDTFTYTIVGTAPFTIDGVQLKTAAGFDRETQNPRTVTVRTTDGAGNTHEQLLTVTITNVNEAPTTVAVTPAVVAENQPSGTTVGTLSTTDPDTGDTFTYTIVGTAPFTIDGTQLKTAAGFDRETQNPRLVTVRSTDAGGLTVETELTITVTNVNEAPAATNDTYAVAPAGITVNTPGVLGNDTDPDVGATLTATLVDDVDAGTLTLNPNGSFTYTPTTGTGAATDSFTYRASDGSLTSNVATVTLNLNQPPTAVADTATTAEDTVVDIDVAANDTDPESPNPALTASSISNVTGGTATPQPGNRIVRFTPAADFTGSASFTYKANDGTLESTTTATVTITITPINDAPVLSGLATAPAAYTEGTGPVPVTSGLDVVDVDSANLASAQVRISAGLEGGDNLSEPSGSGVTSDYDPVTGVLTFTGSASPAVYQDLLRSVLFSNLTNGNPSANRTIEVVVNDGSLNSNAASRGIVITPVNDPPTVTADGSPPTFTEGGSPVVLAPNLNITDPDDTDLAWAEVDLSGGTFVPGEAVLAASTGPGLTSTFNPTTGLLRIEGQAPIATYRDVLRAVTYDNTATSFTSLNHVAKFRVNDGDATSADRSRTFTITPVNNAPVLANLGSSPLTYTEGDPGITLSTTLVVSDPDGDDLVRAFVAIGQLELASGDQLTFTPQHGITGSFSLGTGVLALTGTATPAEYQDVLRSVKYVNTGNLPGTGKAVAFSVDDGTVLSNAPTRIINVTSVNDAPIVTTSDGTTSADEQVATVVDAAVTVSDVDSLIGGATVRVASGHQPGEDVLALPGQPRTGGITATFNSSTGTLTLTGITSSPNYAAALRAVTYTNSSNDPSTAVRTIRFQVTDEHGLAGNTDDKAVQPVDTAEGQPPTDSGESITTVGNTQTWVGRTPAGIIAPRKVIPTGNLLANATDPDTPNAQLEAVLTVDAAHGELFVDADGGWSYRPDAGYTGADSFKYRVTDGSNQSAESTVAITIQGRVWYVNNAGPNGDGRSDLPFNTLEAADVAADAPGDIIYAMRGNAATAGLETPVQLLDDQQLLGHGVDLVIGGETLFDGDFSTPTLVDGSVELASRNTVAGLSWTGAGTGAAIVGRSGDAGGTFSNVRIVGSRPGIDLQGTSGTWTLTSVVVATTTAAAPALRAESAGTLAFTAAGANTFQMAGTGGAFSITGTALSGVIDDVTSSGAASGITLHDTTGSLIIGTVDLVTTGTAIDLDTAPSITIGSGSVTSTGGATGISIVDADQASINVGGSLSGQTDDALRITGGSGAVTYSGSIGDLTGVLFFGDRAVEISDHDGGSIRVTGTIDTNAPFSANDSTSTVEVTGAANVIDTTALVGAVVIQSSPIGPDGITFRSVSSELTQNGIALADTGTGPFTVTGSGTPGSGGSIVNAGNGVVSLDGTGGTVSLRHMSFTGPGIEAGDVRRLVVRDSSFHDSGVDVLSTTGVNDIVIADNTFTDGVTAVTIGNLRFPIGDPSLWTDPTMNLWITGNTMTGTGVGTLYNGVQVYASGHAHFTGTISGNTASNYYGRGIDIFSGNGNPVADYTVVGNTMTAAGTASGTSGITAWSTASLFEDPLPAGLDSTELCLDATGNSIGAGGRPLDFSLHVDKDAKFFIPGLGSSDLLTLFTSRNSAGGPVGDVSDFSTPPDGYFTGNCEVLGPPPG